MAPKSNQPEQKPTTKDLSYINGLTVHNTRMFCGFYFEEFYHSVEANVKDRTFDIYLLKGVDLEKAKKWRKYFGNNFKITILDKTELDDLINA